MPNAAAPGAVPNMGGSYNPSGGSSAPQMPSSGFGGQFPQFYGAPGGQPGGHYPNFAGYGQYPGSGQQSQTSNEK